MGHLGHLKEEYRALVRRLEAGQVAMPEPRDTRARAGWQEILEILYSPEEAALASKMPVRPSSLEALSARLRIPTEELQKRLDPMCDKGVVLDLVQPETGEVKYLLAPPVTGFFEFSMMRADNGIPKKRMAEALEAYTYGDPTFVHELFGGETVIGRALVHERALGDTPRPDVLDWERAGELIDAARTRAVSVCYCRHKNEHLGKDCDAPKEICLSLNAGAEFVIRHGFGKPVEKRDALRMIEEARQAGLVQLADNVKNRPTYICNCCGCCCGQLTAINDFDLPAVNPSGFVAGSDQATCVGCSRCARACPITAIEMRAYRVPGKRKRFLFARVDPERCIGCGVCSTTCKKGAMNMRRRAVPPNVPSNTIERSLRMAIERGHLARLLFDEGAGRGHAFLSQVLQALTSLPGAQRALASKQVRSRFVKAALARVKDPTGD